LPIVPRQLMLFSRLLAAISFLGFMFAAAGTLRLALAEYTSWPVAAGNGRYYQDLAERQPAKAQTALRTAVLVNVRDSASWIALGLAAERDGDMDQAAACLLQAEKIDRQYLPAWTAANFFFRRADNAEFWRAAQRAAAMSYDDPTPLIELADHREPPAIASLERLGDTPRLERGYLHFLIGQGRWREAQEVAARLSFRGDARDRELLLNFIDHLIAANEGQAALAVWNGLRPFAALERARRGTLVNRDFRSSPSGHGFDWRVTEPPGGWSRWHPSRLEFWLTAATPDACTLPEQWVALDRGRYRLRFAYRTEALAAETGLRWVLIKNGRAEAVSPSLANAPQPISNASRTEWSFRVFGAGLYRLGLVNSRVPGTTHQEGHVEFAFAGLEML